MIGSVFGIALSIYDFGGITKWSQVVELGVVAGFLFGSYLLAKEHASGYLWFMLMNSSNCILMYIQGNFYMALQQALSLLFVVYSFYLRKKHIT